MSSNNDGVIPGGESAVEVVAEPTKAEFRDLEKRLSQAEDRIDNLEKIVYRFIDVVKPMADKGLGSARLILQGLFASLMGSGDQAH